MNFTLDANDYEKSRSCWTKFKSYFVSDSAEGDEEIIVESARYQRRKTLPFQLGLDGYPTPIMVTEDDSSYEKQFESKKSGILKPKVKTNCGLNELQY